MALTDFVKGLFSRQEVAETSELHYTPDENGLLLAMPAHVYNQARQAYASNLTLHQFLRMQMLLEEGLAEVRENGIYLLNEEVVALDSDSRHIFNLPPRWEGSFRLQTEGLSHTPGFSLALLLGTEDGESIRHYTLQGPFLKISESEIFLPDNLQWSALQSIARHQALQPAERTEYANLAAVHVLVEAAGKGLKISRAGFENLSTEVPESVGLAVELCPDGSLELTPAFAGCDQTAIQERLGQLNPEGQAQSLRIGKQILLLDEERLQAAHQIIRKRRIPASQRRRFLAAPGSYLDAALINLDAGFSIRVKGVGPFMHAYFGETDANNINWFEQSGSGVERDILALAGEGDTKETLVQPADLPRLIKDPALLGDLREKLEDAKATNAGIIKLDAWRINVEDRERVHQAIEQLEEIFSLRPMEEESGPLALDIHLNDMEADHGREMNAPSKGIQSAVEIDFNAYTRTPFPHQVEGVRWMLAMAKSEGQPEGDEHKIHGALLADDMGLGKTYMSIVGIREILLHNRSNKPVLVVAPLSLLENWKREVQATYKEPLFERIIILQADGDLPAYRIDGRSVETKRHRPHELAVEKQTEAVCADGTNNDAPPWETEPPEIIALAGEADNLVKVLDDGSVEALETVTENIAATEGDIGGKQPDETPNTQVPEAAEDENEAYLLQCALKIGPEWGPDRLDLPSTLVLTTYQTLRDYQFSLAAVPWSVVVFDEAQNIKSPNTLQTRAAKALNAEFKLMVTGTPVENHLGEFWCLFDTMQPGFLGSYQEFRQNYIRPILKALPEELNEVREEIGKQLRERVGGLMLRRIKEDHLTDMPKKHIVLGDHDDKGDFHFDERVSGSMSGEQRLRYEDIMQTTLDDMDDELVASAALRGLQQLRAASLHHSLLSEMPLLPRTAEEARELFMQSGKLGIVLRLLDEIRERGEKALIFAVNKRLQELVAVCVGRIYGLRVAIINGSTKAVSNNPNNPTRQAIIDDFQATEGFNVLVISPVAAGVGLTITAANNVIHLERHWNPAKEAQATDRAYRIGQTKDVFVYIPILTHPDYDSFDVNLNRLLMSKMSLSDAIITQEEVTVADLAGSGMFKRSKA